MPVDADNIDLVFHRPQAIPQVAQDLQGLRAQIRLIGHKEDVVAEADINDAASVLHHFNGFGEVVFFHILLEKRKEVVELLQVFRVAGDAHLPGLLSLVSGYRLAAGGAVGVNDNLVLIPSQGVH